MRAFKSISVRLLRGTALSLLFSYSALVVLLSVHYHTLPVVPNHAALWSASAETGQHGHVIATCPLQFYLLSAFQAEPGLQAHPAVLTSARTAFLPSTPDCLSFSGTFRLSRAPPHVG